MWHFATKASCTSQMNWCSKLTQWKLTCWTKDAIYLFLLINIENSGEKIKDVIRILIKFITVQIMQCNYVDEGFSATWNIVAIVSVYYFLTIYTGPPECAQSRTEESIDARRRNLSAIDNLPKGGLTIDDVPALSGKRCDCILYPVDHTSKLKKIN